MSRVAALLRGVNLGGRARVPMAELKAALEEAGLMEVVTYVQSGNVVFAAGPKDRDDARLVADVISQRFGLDITVITRSARQLAAISKAHPLGREDATPIQLHVVFLEDRPDTDAVAALEPDRFPPDRFEVAGREIYVEFPNGQGRSKLGLDYFEKTLGIRGTMRNWNTVNRLAEMTRG